jgi:hypothetical protein
LQPPFQTYESVPENWCALYRIPNKKIQHLYR